MGVGLLLGAEAAAAQGQEGWLGADFQEDGGPGAGQGVYAGGELYGLAQMLLPVGQAEGFVGGNDPAGEVADQGDARWVEGYLAGGGAEAV